MKKTGYAVWLISGLLWACGSATPDGSGGQSEEITAETLGKAVMSTGLSEVPPITVEELETWLPETLLGMPLKSTQPGSMSKRGISGIGANYGDSDNKNIVVTITDCAGPEGGMVVGMFRPLATSEFDRSSESGYERTVTENGIKAVESFSQYENNYSVAIFYKERFAINLNGYSVARDELWEAVGELPLDRLFD